MLVSCQMGLILKSIKIRFYIYLEKTKILKVGIFAHSGLAFALCVKIDHLFSLVLLKSNHVKSSVRLFHFILL